MQGRKIPPSDEVRRYELEHMDYGEGKTRDEEARDSAIMLTIVFIVPLVMGVIVLLTAWALGDL